MSIYMYYTFKIFKSTQIYKHKPLKVPLVVAISCTLRRRQAQELKGAISAHFLLKKADP